MVWSCSAIWTTRLPWRKATLIIVIIVIRCPHFAASNTAEVSALGSCSPRVGSSEAVHCTTISQARMDCMDFWKIPCIFQVSWHRQASSYTQTHSGDGCLQEFFDTFLPTREVFAALVPFALQLAPRNEQEVQVYKAKRFRLYNIGMQIRRRKCNGDRHDLSCELRPSIESYRQVGSAFRSCCSLR